MYRGGVSYRASFFGNIILDFAFELLGEERRKEIFKFIINVG